MDFLFYLALIPALAVAAQWIAWRTNLPGILLLLLIGVAVGGLSRPDDLLAELVSGDPTITGPRILFPLVSLAVAVIMLEGGLSLKLSELREAGSPAFRLCTLGAAVTATAATIAAHFCFDFTWRLSALLGAILVVTGPTVIGPLLQQVKPSRRVANTLKWEGIVIDPIGAVLAVLVFEILLLHPGKADLGHGVMLLGWTVLVGAVLGAAGGWALTQGIRRYLIPDHLHGVVSLTTALLLFAVSDHFAHESGLITVTVLGIWLTNQHEFDIEHIIEFKEHLRTLLIGCLFIVLGSRVDITTVGQVGWAGLLFVALLIVVIRPLSVFVSLLGSGLSFREQTFIATLAPRGIVAAAVSSIFALRIEQTAEIDLAGADQLAIITFLVIISTVAFYGLLASPIAQALGLSDPNRNGVLIAGADDWVIRFALELKKAGCPVIMIDTNYRKVTKAKLEGLEAICANIMNEHARDELSLPGIGHMLAMTPNDEVNSLAVRECRSVFGRAKTYQLTFKSENPRGMTRHLMGRELFDSTLTHSKISQLVAQGFEFKTTAISDEFTFQDFKNLYAEQHVLAIISDKTPPNNERMTLTLVTADEAAEPEAGDAVLALVKPLQSDPAS
ncbi:cation:proton antiporter [Stieleria sp. ICT_E10.1]|uniref:cation:proton antiporter n=1 Tax=Stieleria sedimenti TaxID=2976331 RepID=UPI00218096FC|nr:sodium:proton antiporter [Stieleria sedimenti]MCS7466025.1 cation:proton antiporter [Stieleria sedimenti]